MTVRELYAIAAAMVGDRENIDKDERDLSVQYMNVLLQEALPCENSIRAKNGDRELDSAPFAMSLDDSIIYDNALVRAAFPYGLAWQFHQADGNLGLAAQYRNMFIDAVNSNYCFSVRKYK